MLVVLLLAMLRRPCCCRRCLRCPRFVVKDLVVLAAVVLLPPMAAWLFLEPMGPRSLAILVVVAGTFVVIFVWLVLVRAVLRLVTSAGSLFRSLGRSVWTSTRCLCLFLHLCCLWMCLLGRRRRVTMGS